MKRSSNQSDEWLEEKTRALHDGQPRRVAVFLRSLAPPLGTCQQQKDVLDQLRSFERQGLFGGVETTVWGESICPDSEAAATETGSRVLEYVDEFCSWTDRMDPPANPPFEETTVTSSFTDDQYRKIVLPQICLAIYTGEQLELVLPCTVDDHHYSVHEFLASIEQQTLVEQGIGTSA